MSWDLFISYASEEREKAAKPLADKLRDIGLTVWFDEYELTIGDRLHRKIDEGLSKSSYGLVILSKSFFNKHYPRYELDALAQKEVDGKDVILPIWYDVNEAYIRQYSLALADRIAVKWDDGLENIVKMIVSKVKPQKQMSNVNHIDLKADFESEYSDIELEGNAHDILDPPKSEELDSHYKLVLSRITDGRLVPFLGDGIHLFGRQPGSKWKYGQFDCPPNRKELAKYLADKFSVLGSKLDLARVAQYIATSFGDGPLCEELHSILDADYRPTELHQFFAKLPALLREKGHTSSYQLIVTTNYDDVLESAFKAVGEPFDLLFFSSFGDHRGKLLHWLSDGELRVIEKPNKYIDPSLAERTVILKLNGTVDRSNGNHDSFVVTEDQYMDLAGKDFFFMVPPILANKMSMSSILFLGCSQGDWNQRVLSSRILGRPVLRYKSWCIAGDVSKAESNFWMKSGVDVFNIRLEDYIKNLGLHLERLTSVVE
jgi:hypothetical protein